MAKKSDDSIIKVEVGNTWLCDVCLVFPLPDDGVVITLRPNGFL